MPLSVLVDARALTHSGIGRYLREVLDRLLADERFGRVVMLGHLGDVERYAGGHRRGEKIRPISFPYDWYSARAQARWATLLARNALNVDVAFFPHYDVPALRVPAPYVVTIQDLIHWEVPELFPAWKRKIAATVLRRAVTRAESVVVSSGSTRADLLKRHPAVAGKVRLIAHGTGSEFTTPGQRSIPEEVQALRPYLLAVGNRKAHKNLVAAVETLARLRAERPDIRLVIVGRDFGEDAEVLRRAGALGALNSVVIRGATDDAELRDLYAGAECLLFPSLYEGFGLPILEAMGCGTPVVASNRSSIPEVCGEAAMLLDPHDHDGMAAAVRSLNGDPQLRGERVARGRERALSLTWDSTAAQTLDLLVRVAGSVATATDSVRTRK
ncbi:MAG: glycosyltransferase family 4 protein [Gemmatimonadota bacterium]|nr:glycosyltransferase family 4 protein [Gemmatimonadota bacterium]